MITSAIKVKCKKCGRDAKSDEFILDPIYKLMVCKDCVKERKMNEYTAKKNAMQAEMKAKQEEVKKQHPAGWDSDDLEIERRYKEKQVTQATVERINDEKVKYTCKKCKYEFIYNTLKNQPARCPYCGTAVNI
jgi:DNA-directed RNA polymerase subunit RPC12/RpoP